VSDLRQLRERDIRQGRSVERSASARGRRGGVVSSVVLDVVAVRFESALCDHSLFGGE
jgi:hypothetical protein